MNLDLYSDRAKQAVQSAQSLALARSHQQFSPDHLLKVLLDDSEGIVADLDAGMQSSIDAYRDPWGQDGKQPATPGQFRSSLPLIPLPKVPVR